MTKLKVLMVVVAMLSLQLVAAAPAMASPWWEDFDFSEISVGGDFVNAAGPGGNGGSFCSAQGGSRNLTVGPSVDCSGGDGGDTTIVL